VLTVAVLGPVEVRRDRQRISAPSGKTTEVLVRLALEVGQPVRTERLIEDLWADDAAATGRNTLLSKVSQLRRAPGDAGVIAATNGACALAVDPAAVDAQEVVGVAAT
jgi:DNA-binding SARP family transcriptional activator